MPSPALVIEMTTTAQQRLGMALGVFLEREAQNKRALAAAMGAAVGNPAITVTVASVAGVAVRVLLLDPLHRRLADGIEVTYQLTCIPYQAQYASASAAYSAISSALSLASYGNGSAYLSTLMSYSNSSSFANISAGIVDAPIISSTYVEKILKSARPSSRPSSAPTLAPEPSFWEKNFVAISAALGTAALLAVVALSAHYRQLWLPQATSRLQKIKDGVRTQRLPRPSHHFADKNAPASPRVGELKAVESRRAIRSSVKVQPDPMTSAAPTRYKRRTLLSLSMDSVRMLGGSVQPGPEPPGVDGAAAVVAQSSSGEETETAPVESTHVGAEAYSELSSSSGSSSPSCSDSDSSSDGEVGRQQASGQPTVALSSADTGDIDDESDSDGESEIEHLSDRSISIVVGAEETRPADSVSDTATLIAEPGALATIEKAPALGRNPAAMERSFGGGSLLRGLYTALLELPLRRSRVQPQTGRDAAAPAAAMFEPAAAPIIAAAPPRGASFARRMYSTFLAPLRRGQGRSVSPTPSHDFLGNLYPPVVESSSGSGSGSVALDASADLEAMQRVVRAFLDRPVLTTAPVAESLDEMLRRMKRKERLTEQGGDDLCDVGSVGKGKESAQKPGPSSFQLWLDAHRVQSQRGPLLVSAGAAAKRPAVKARELLRGAVEARLVARLAKVGDTMDKFHDDVDI